MAKKSKTDTTAETSQADDASSMQVKIYAPYKVYFNGEAQSVSAVNDTGTFDILGKHHNFISLLNPCDIHVRTPDGEEEKIKIQQGVIHVKANQVIVFLDV